MSVRSLQQGIEAIQQNHLVEGARLLRLAIKDETLPPHLKATAFAWLSNTQDDVAFKIECYQKAVAADPQNSTYAQHLNMLLASQVPAPRPPSPTPPSPTPQQPYTPPRAPDVYGGGYPTSPTNTGLYPVTPNPGQGGGASYPTAPRQPTEYGQARSTGQYPSVAPQTNYGTPASTGTYGALGGPVLTLNEAQRSVGIVGGPNGKGSGFFVTRDGLVATTRFVVGSEESLTIQLQSGQTLAGRVVRGFPLYDLALIKVPVQLVNLLSVAHMPMMAENIPLTVLAHPGELTRTARRETREQMPPQWFPTLLNRLQDAGGDPIYNPQNELIGMMTRNASRSTGYFHGLHINAIFQCTQQFVQEAQQLTGQGIYCTSCGTSSRAGAFKAYYCESCGSVLPPAMDIRRKPLENVGALYGETMHGACPNCRSTVGYYNGICLRCGFDVSQRR